MKTANEWIDAFDRGEVIESVDMGGISDGYEMAIQSLVVEIVRKVSSHDVPKEMDTFKALLGIAKDQSVNILDGIHGFSGAQIGASTNLAAIIWRRGIDSFQDVKDRIIKIQKADKPYRVNLIDYK
jgi:hypothetical protein